MSGEKVVIPGYGLTLEGVLALPRGKGPFGLVVVCHPHPLYGGNMHNNIVEAVCAGVGKQNLAWLKFNFRGVGESEGRYDGGKGERNDVKAAITFAAGNDRVDPGRIGVCGYSFGSMVAFATAAEDERVRAIAGISPLLQPAGILNDYKRPKLFICGEDDELINVRSLAEQVGSLPEPKELIICPGADHFWWGREEKVASLVGQFFAGHLGGRFPGE